MNMHDYVNYSTGEDESINIDELIEEIDSLSSSDLLFLPKLQYYIDVLEDFIPFDSQCYCPHTMPPCAHCENYGGYSDVLNKLQSIKTYEGIFHIVEEIKTLSIDELRNHSKLKEWIFILESFKSKSHYFANDCSSELKRLKNASSYEYLISENIESISSSFYFF